MVSIFWDSEGVIMIDYLEQGRPIISAYYAGKLRWLSQEITGKRKGKLTGGVLLLEDNAPAHTSQVAMTASTECEILPYRTYPSNTAPSDFYTFPKLKSNLHGTQYGSYEGVMETVNEYLGGPRKCLLF